MRVVWPTQTLGVLAHIRISNVDKKVHASECPVRLCNYMDVYSNDYITNRIQFMEASATKAEIERFGLIPGDVIITKDSESPDDIGIPAVISEKIDNLVCGYHLALIRPDADLLDSVYLAKQLSTSRVAQYFSLLASGSTRYGLPISAIEGLEIPTPPKPEQTKIANIFSTVDQAIEQMEALIAKQQRIKTGLMQDLLTLGMDEKGNLRSEETHEFKDSPLGKIPAEWEVATLRSKGHPSRAHIKTGPFGSALKSEHWVEVGMPVITIGALGEGQFIDSNLLFVKEKTAQRLASYALVEGDIVFSRVADVGRSVVVTAGEFGWIMSSNLMRISLDQNLVNPRFAQLCIGHDQRIRMQIRRLVNAGGRDIANSAVMNALAFCWPSKDEQDIIVSRLEALSLDINKGIASRGKLLSIKTGLMQDLLTGKKRVTPLMEPELTN